MVEGDEQPIVVVDCDPGKPARVTGVVENMISAGEFQRVRVIDCDDGIFPDLAVLESGVDAVVGFRVADAADVCETVVVLELLRNGERV